MVIKLEMTTETKPEENKNKVGNRWSQVGNKGGHRLETKEANSSAEITAAKILKGKSISAKAPLYTL